MLLGGLGLLHSTHPVDAATYVASLLPMPADMAFDRSAAQGASVDKYVGMVSINDANEPRHAVLWKDLVGAPIDLHLPQFYLSEALGVFGDTQVGYVGGGIAGDSRFPMVWHGSAASAVNLLPTGYVDGVARAAYGSLQGGEVVPTPIPGAVTSHAAMWNGSADSFADLHPTGYFASGITSLSNSSQVGNSWSNDFAAKSRALLWHGTAASVVDLNPTGFIESVAYDCTDSLQVGAGRKDLVNQHALLWSGSAGSVVDLNPPGFLHSQARAISGNTQVGHGGRDAGEVQALLWQGSASSVIDLHEYAQHLVVNGRGSVALDIDSRGNVIGAVWGSDFAQRAVLWTRVPEPRGSNLLVTAVVLLFSASRLSHVLFAPR